MKKLIYSIFAIAALAACNKAEDPSSNDGSSSEPKGFVIKISTDIKASFDENTYNVSWKANEELKVFINGEGHTFTRIEDTDLFACEDFTPVEGTSYHYEVLTPYRSDWGDLVFSYSGAASDPKMYGEAYTTGSESPSIDMQHLTAVIRTTIKNTGNTDLVISSIRIESDSQNIGGRYKMVGGEPDPVNPVTYTEMNNQNIRIAANSEKAVCLTCAPFTSTDGETLTFTFKAAADVFYCYKTLSATPVHFVAGKVNNTTVELSRQVAAASAENTVLVDFGGTRHDNEWNTYNKRGTDATDYVDLNNAAGTASGLTMATKAAFDGTGYTGSVSGTWTENGVTYPTNVWKDGMLAKTNPGKLEISGCDTNSKYTIETTHIRYGGSRGIRIFDMNINGTSISKVDTGMPANTAEGTYTYALVYHDVTPDADGKITITMTPLLGSNSSVKEAPINSMVITKK